jgi:hypothetical protein
MKTTRDYLIMSLAKRWRENPEFGDWLPLDMIEEALKITDEEIAEFDARMKRLEEENERRHQKYLDSLSPKQRMLEDLIAEHRRIIRRLETATEQDIWDGISPLPTCEEIFEEFSDNEEVKKIHQEMVELVGRWEEYKGMN